ncbi:hypothetical protein BDV96DRAFT_688680 [Lophiotrema nucula]|uniref:Uncharacterized protein n=1 Tax=Lophiotrema nucula TaxID=690887 RepID=A0A6A5Z2R4_9PLEO|nr:hypothetical protein BDV96DRAFT_688680 [Lophiotrema nucula]
MAPKLEQHFTVRVYLTKDTSLSLKGIKGGPTRVILPITKGFVKGKGLEAEITGGGDYILLDPTTNVCHLNVRTQARTATGTSNYIHYNGTLKVDEATSKVISWSPDANTTNYGDHKWFVTPIMETDDEEFKWIEDQTWVGQGHWIVEGGETAVEYEVYQVVN